MCCPAVKTIVCEAAASGAMLITSRWVGASADLVRSGINGLVFHEMTAASLAAAFTCMSGWDDTKLVNAQKVSLGVAEGYSSECYFSAVKSLIALSSK